ncbi:alpha/beta hydrolase [Amycolatopsis sp.]|uniref:alpha/beta hydrolase n=1 Tax=Amycolatopsis sp. TaxID=37632 RepID=UPI002E0757A7|nr:alpha/beta hydrolase [Amycolatopsis sp.]
MFRTVTTLVIAALLTTTSGGAVAQANDQLTLRLPAPTGHHQIGTTALHLVDPTRKDPWNDAPKRELMVSVFYPAKDVRGRQVAPQMTPRAAESFKAFAPRVHTQLPKDGVDWAATKTHSYVDAPAQTTRRPVVLYTPGGAEPRTLGTGVAEELASNGFVVVTIDHSGEASEVDFPGGLRQIDLPPDPAQFPQTMRTVIDTRFADTKFVLGQLEVLAAGRNPDADRKPLPQNLGRALDLRKIGIYGHSVGGGTAAETMHEDRRVDAAISMESYLSYYPAPAGQPLEQFPIARDGTDRPLLVLSSDYWDADMQHDWAPLVENRTTRRIDWDNAQHYVFTDYAAMLPQLQRAGLMTAQGRQELVGAIDPARSVPSVRKSIVDFFDCHLR